MARPVKDGLDYFPFDVDFFNDEKIEAISGEFGIKGEATVIRLLCAIYRNGYFIEWSEMLKMKLLKNLQGVSKELLEQIVERLVKWGFFDKDLFNSEKILTSKGIQSRYQEATKRRKNTEFTQYWLLKEVNVNKNPQSKRVNARINTQSKVKERKVKEIKESDNALAFLEKNHTQRFQQEFLMAFKNQIKDFKRFCENFNDTAEQEKLSFEVETLLPRLKKYARNWISNQRTDKSQPKKTFSTNR